MTTIPLAAPDLPWQQAGIAALIGIWEQAMAQFADAVESAGPEAWTAPTPCPGWSVADVVAHVTAIEREQLDRTDPVHEPDWARLPHVTSEFGRRTEVPVDLRRGWSRADVLAEFAETIDARRSQLGDGPTDAGELVPNFLGGVAPFDTVMRTRIFDTWVHEQDVRTAAGTPGNLATPAAWIAAGRMVGALGYVWARAVGAPAGATARLVVTGPGVRFTAAVVTGADGRGFLIDSDEPATTTVRLPWPRYAALSCGRLAVGGAPALEGADAAGVVSGDAELGARLLGRLTITP